ncbi:Nuclear receptor coactivator 7, partial [Varanus komodoensis]
MELIDLQCSSELKAKVREIEKIGSVVLFVEYLMRPSLTQTLLPAAPSLKKKRLAKQNTETASTNASGTPASRTQTGKEDGSRTVLVQNNGCQENCKLSGEKEDYEKKKKKSSQPKDIRRTDLKRYYSIGEFCKSCLLGMSGKALKAVAAVAACEYAEKGINVEWEEALPSSGYSSATGDSCESLPEAVAHDHSSGRMAKKKLLKLCSFSAQKHFSWSVDYRQPYLVLDDNQTKTNEKKEKKMVSQKPSGTIQYTAGSKDTLNNIALKFNITPNKLVELNKLFTHTIVPGQVLYVPDAENMSAASKLASSSPGATVSPSSSDAEYDKLPDADLARRACRPLQRVLSSTSEEDEPIVGKFLKMNCRYFTDGKGVVGGVMLITPNNIMFDPHKSDPLVIENGCEEYGLICPMEEVVSIALYNDISHMKIKDALPSDIPKDLCPLYRPGEWEDLASEKDINPFSKFKSMNKEKKQQKVNNFVTLNSNLIKPSKEGKVTDFEIVKPAESSPPVTPRLVETTRDSIIPEPSRKLGLEIYTTGHSVENVSLELTKDNSLLEEDGFTELEETSLQPHSRVDCGDAGTVEAPKDCKIIEEVQLLSTNKENSKQSVSDSSGPKHEAPKDVLDLESSEKLDAVPEMNKGGCSPTNKADITLDANKELNKDKLIEFYLNEDKDKPVSTDVSCKTELMEEGNNIPVGIDLTLSSSKLQTAEVLKSKKEDPDSCSIERKGPLSEADSGAGAEKKECDGSIPSSLASHLDNKSEIRLWLLQRIQVPIEDILPSKEEKSKTPPMFLCIKVGKPMRKSFTSQSTTMAQQYGKRRKQPEYWFAVPRERVDHLYTFFVQWSPDVYGKDAKDQGFVVVEKEELDMIDNFFSEPSTKSWEKYQKLLSRIETDSHISTTKLWFSATCDLLISFHV